MINQLIKDMMQYDSGDAHRIQHFIKVHSNAKLIGESEQLDTDTLFTLEIASVLHDIGIKKAEELHGHCAGELQEKYGPEEAKTLLKKYDLTDSTLSRVLFLIGNHHTYTNVDGLDYRILLEADFLVNLHENNSSKESCLAAYNKIFRTETGKTICETMFLK